MDKQTLLELIDEKVNEIFLLYQNAHNITDGGIEPFDALHLDRLEEQLAEHIIHVCKKQPKEIDLTLSWYIYTDSDGGVYDIVYGHNDTEKFFCDVSRRICFDDCSNETVEQIFWQGKEVKYVGWQPCMVFEYKDLDGNTVWVGQFENWDH
jgi:hypothetical protein